VRKKMKFRILGLVVTAMALSVGCNSEASPAGEPADRATAIPVAQDIYPPPDGAWDIQHADFQAMMERARAQTLYTRPVSERMVGFGAMFIGLPYVAHTLEMPGPEQLVVNLKELDCVTLVENTLALSFAAGADDEYASFLQALQSIRYRGGSMDGYTSRLHYSSDWIADNERKGTLRDITRELGGERATKQISFMSNNSDAYRQLRERPELVDSIRMLEAALNAREWYWIPQDRIAGVESQIEEGDIIGITTAIQGLDISHTGLATWRNGRLYILHAPDVGQPVEISRQPLAERIRGSRLQNGIMVARPVMHAR
jgi:hypothetical protein